MVYIKGINNNWDLSEINGFNAFAQSGICESFFFFFFFLRILLGSMDSMLLHEVWYFFKDDLMVAV